MVSVYDSSLSRKQKLLSRPGPVTNLITYQNKILFKEDWNAGKAHSEVLRYINETKLCTKILNPQYCHQVMKKIIT